MAVQHAHRATVTQNTINQTSSACPTKPTQYPKSTKEKIECWQATFPLLSFLAFEEEQNVPPPNMSLGREDFCGLKAINTQQTQEDPFTSASRANISIGNGAWSRERVTTFLPKKLTCIPGQTLFYKHLLLPSCVWPSSPLGSPDSYSFL